VNVGTPPAAGPTAPTALAAAVQAGPQVRLTWTDNADNETGFVVERGADGVTFAQIATVGPRTTGSATVTYVDTTVTAGNTFFYRVKAVNAGGSSAYSPTTPPQPAVSVTVPALPAAPTGFTATNTLNPVNGPNTTVTLNWAYPVGTNITNFTIERAENATFTTNLATFTPTASARSLTQTVRDNTTYYYRIRANNTISGSSAWTHALPFPIRTAN